MNFDIQTRGGKELLTALRNAPEEIRRSIQDEMNMVKDSLIQYIRDEKLSGQVLNTGTGELKDSLYGDVQANRVNVRLTVSTGSIPYAEILEEGGQTSPHVITATKADMLRFVMGGSVIFRHSVNHPGSNFPARSYMASSLYERVDAIRQQILEAVNRGLGVLSENSGTSP